jgi:hypothetical protein
MQTEMNLRPALTEHLRQRLNAFDEGFRHNLALIGPPGSGKTFQLEQVLQEPRSSAVVWCPVYRESPRSFLQRMLAAILKAGLRTEASGMTWTALLQEADAVLPKTASAIRSIEGLLGRHVHGEAFSRALDAIPVMAAERRRACIVVLDEFLLLEEIGFGQAFHELGKRVMTWPSTVFILASSSPYRAKLILRERLQLLFGQFELIHIDAFDSHSGDAWVRRQLGDAEGAEAISRFVLRWLGSYPQHLTVLLKRLRELMVLQQVGGLGMSSMGQTSLCESLFVDAMWDVLGSPQGALYQWCLSSIEGLLRDRRGARALDALIQIADGARTMSEVTKRLGRAGLSDSLQLLVEYDLAERNGMCWAVPDPILRCWLTTVLAAQRHGLDTEEAALRSRLEQYVITLWSQWLHASTLEFSEQVTQLLAKFRDDTVSIDSKTGRLPRFDTICAQAADASSEEVYVMAEGEGRRWCCAVRTGPVDEQAVARFEMFCQSQAPRPSRKVVITKSGLDRNAKLLAKSTGMWVWEPRALQRVMSLYGQLLGG